ncbi:hypothetical protein MTO96_033572, partial [Rhipicephalus appendiculatus]
DDAAEAVNHGAAAILVSNHGARQIDGEPSTIECLPEVGKEGVDQVLAILRSELDRAMGLLGCRTISDLTPDLVVREERFSRL